MITIMVAQALRCEISDQVRDDTNHLRTEKIKGDVPSINFLKIVGSLQSKRGIAKQPVPKMIEGL